MYVCMYVYIHVCMYIYIYIYIYVSVDKFVATHLCVQNAFTFSRIHTQKRVVIPASISCKSSSSSSSSVNKIACIYTHTYAHTCTPTGTLDHRVHRDCHQRRDFRAFCGHISCGDCGHRCVELLDLFM